MMDLKIILGFSAAVLGLISFIPYLRDILRKKTTPHPYSWFLWTLQTFIVYGLQVTSGAGPGSWMTLSVGAISLVIFILSLKNAKEHITLIDSVFLVLTLFSLGIWLITKQPVFSIVLLTVVDILTFIPTIRKSWHKPHSETLSTYELGALRNGLSILALENLNIVTWLNPFAMVIVNIIFSGILIIRRNSLKKV